MDGEIDRNDSIAGKNHAEMGQSVNSQWTLRQATATVSLCILWVGEWPGYCVPISHSCLTGPTGSQVPLYFTGGILSYMVADLGPKAQTSSSWIPVCNTLTVAAVAPFTGYLADIFGQRNIVLGGSLLIMVGLVIVATSHSFGQAVAGMAISGAGAGVGELTALAG